MDKPICSICESENKEYWVTSPGGGWRTLTDLHPYWDENGKYHQPDDPNYTTYTYQCTNGHSWRERK